MRTKEHVHVYIHVHVLADIQMYMYMYYGTVSIHVHVQCRCVHCIDTVLCETCSERQLIVFCSLEVIDSSHLLGLMDRER